MKMLPLLLCCILFAYSGIGQNLNKEQQTAVQHFIDMVKRGDKEGIGNLIRFPLGREYPLPTIKDKADFEKHYNQIFDDSFKILVTKTNPATDWTEVGWRGISIGDGPIWLDDEGRIEGINYQSPWEQHERQRLIEEDRASLYPTLQDFTESVLIMETSTYRIRIDDLGGQNYRYASWKKEHSMGEEPDIIIIKGQVEYDGSGGNHHYTFQNNGYTYTCDIIVMGDDNSPPAMLTISKGDKDVLTQKAVSLKGE